MSRSWKVEVCQRKKKTRRRDDHSAISSKEHVKYEATQTYLSVTYQHDRLHSTGKRPRQQSQGPQQQQSTPPVFLQKVFSGEKNTKRCDTGTNACDSLVSSVRGYCLPTATFAWRSLTTGGTIIFSLVFCVENVFPVFWYTLPPCHKICHRQKACCV